MLSLLFGNVKKEKKKLISLYQQKKETSVAKSLLRIYENEISKIAISYGFDGTKNRFFVKLISHELISILFQLEKENIDFFIEQSEQLLEQLAQRCVWRLNAEKEETAEYAKKADFLHKNIIFEVENYKSKLKSDQTNFRVFKNLIYEDDLERIIYRTSRAVVAIAKKDTQKPIFSFNNNQIEFDSRLYFPYFLEQLDLYVYLFKNKERATFILNTCSFVTNYVKKELRFEIAEINDDDLKKIAEDISSKVQFDFLNKHSFQSANHTNFFLDSSFKTYLFGFIHQANLIEKQVAKYYESQQRQKDDLPNSREFYNDDDEAERYKQIIHFLEIIKKRLNRKCAELIDFLNEKGRIPKECIDAIRQIAKQEKINLSFLL